jgi:hypothetical protein
MPIVITDPSSSPGLGSITAQQIINRAAEIIGYKDPDESLSSTDSTNFLGVLNDMLDGWNSQRLFIVNVGEVVQNVSGSPITIGPGGTINVTRPINIEDGSFIRLNDADFQITWIQQIEYNSIIVKDTPGNVVRYGYYQQSTPVGEIYLWPVPSTSVELHLQLQTQLVEFADLTTGYTLAQGYKKALTYSLAEEIAPGRRTLDPKVERIALAARKAIRRNNVDVPLQNLNPSGPSPYAVFIAGL